jgi:hypothetical protein
MTTTTTLNGVTNPAIYLEATNETNLNNPRAWPKVTVRETTDAERTKALTVGTKALASIVAAEERKLRALKAMLNVARAVSQDQKALNDAGAVMAWGDGLDALYRNYDEVGVTQTMMDLGDAARRAERLAIVSGHAIFAAGGSMTEPGSFVATSRSHVAEQIVEHGDALNVSVDA